MSFYNDKYVRTGNAIIVWDGITRPETNDSGVLIHKIKVAMAPGSLEAAELEQLAQTALKDSKYNGVLPPNGNWPTSVAAVGQIDPAVDGYTLLGAGTQQGAPQVFDANGQELSPMQYGPMLYCGAVVQVLVHAFAYDNINKGVAFGLDGIMIVDAKAPRLSIAGVNASAAFGAPAAVAPAAVAPAAVAPAAVAPAAVAPAAVQPAPDFLTPVTAKAVAEGQTYEGLKGAGWTDDQMRANGYIV